MTWPGRKAPYEPARAVFVKTLHPDHTKPEIDGRRGYLTITAEPTNPKAPTGETLVRVSFKARDPRDKNRKLEDVPSGISSAHVALRGPQGEEFGMGGRFQNAGRASRAVFANDPGAWRKFHHAYVLPVGSKPGVWGLSSISVGDAAGNMADQSFVELMRFEEEKETHFSVEEGDALHVDFVLRQLRNGAIERPPRSITIPPGAIFLQEHASLKRCVGPKGCAVEPPTQDRHPPDYKAESLQSP